MHQTVLLQKVHSSGGETIHFFQVIIFKTNLKEGYSKYILIFFHSTHLLSFGLCWIFSQKLYLIDIHHEQVFPGQITSLPPSKRYRLKPGWKGKSWSTLSPHWWQNLGELLDFSLDFLFWHYGMSSTLLENVSCLLKKK